MPKQFLKLDNVTLITCYQSSYLLGMVFTNILYFILYYIFYIFLLCEISFKNIYFHIFAEDTIMAEQLVYGGPDM